MYTFCFSEFKKIPFPQIHPSMISVSALISALIYVFNLGTVQQFILPFEMFVVQFALLPWILFVSSHLIESISNKKLMVFVLITLLFASSAYAATLWYTFFIIYFFWLALHISKSTIRNILVL